MTDDGSGERPRPRFRRPEPGLPRRLVDQWLLPIRVAASWPGGKGRLLRRVLIVNTIDATALFLVAAALPGIDVRTWIDAFVVTFSVAILTILVRPAVLALTRWSFAVAFVMSLGLNAVLLQLAAAASDAFHVANFAAALAAAFGVAAMNTFVNGVLSLDEDESFYGNVLKRMSRDLGPVDDCAGPGTVLVQVDGLAAPVLRHAVRTGYMPFVATLLRSGSHRLVEWETDLPSMTSSAQAGILHGNNAGIPAFRWFEKDRGRLMVSNRPADAAEIERRVRGARDLLHPAGTSVANLLSGGAERSLLTTSTLHLSPGLLLGGRGAEELNGYFINPYNFFRAVTQSLWIVLLEWVEARRQRLRDVQPRMHRGGVFPLLRAAASVVLRDVTTTAVIEDMQRGAPIIYADVLAYDEIAHHAGPERPESMRELEAVDRQLRTIVRGAAGAPRDYRFVLLSDHGQSLGATFRQRYGEDLETLLGRLASGAPTVRAATEDVESWGPVNALLTQLTGSGRAGSRVARRVLRRRTRDGYVELGPGGRDARDQPAGEVPEIVVCASGNLALVYFNALAGRATLEEIESIHPRLVGRLASHPGIGFVLARSGTRGALAIGSRGVHLLDEHAVEGEDPLVPYGPRTADRLRRLDGFATTGDLVLVSVFDASTEEVAAFEELIGSHGGLGGPQTQAFLVVPSAWRDGGEPVVGAEAVNAALRRWIAGEPEEPADLQELRVVAAAPPGASAPSRR